MIQNQSKNIVITFFFRRSSGDLCSILILQIPGYRLSFNYHNNIIIINQYNIRRIFINHIIQKPALVKTRGKNRDFIRTNKRNDEKEILLNII